MKSISCILEFIFSLYGNWNMKINLVCFLLCSVAESVSLHNLLASLNWKIFRGQTVPNFQLIMMIS